MTAAEDVTGTAEVTPNGKEDHVKEDSACLCEDVNVEAVGER